MSNGITYEFGDQESMLQLAPCGDYIATVVEAEQSIVTGQGKTRGSDRIDLRLELTVPPSKEYPNGQTSYVREGLIFHPACNWKIDTFLKSFNFFGENKPKKGEQVNVNCESLLGLRGWITNGHDTDSKNPDKKYNRVVAFITSKPKLTRIHIDPPAQTPEETPEF